MPTEPTTLFLSRADIAAAVPVGEALDLLAEGFRTDGTGGAAPPGRGPAPTGPGRATMPDARPDGVTRPGGAAPTGRRQACCPACRRAPPGR